MNREYHCWHSPALRREMELLVFGHAGARLFAFPTGNGRFYEWEDCGMIDTLHDHIDNGWVQVYCVDNIAQESWLAYDQPVKERLRRHTQFNNYLLHELMPMSQRKNKNDFLITVGTEFGAYYALNLALRHPHQVGRTIGMSGCYDISQWAEDFESSKLYENNPYWFIRKEHDINRLRALRRMDIILAVGQDDASRKNNEQLSGLLWDKQIGNALRLWQGNAQDWDNWRKMLRLYIGGHD